MPELSIWSASKTWLVLSTKNYPNFYKTATCSHHFPLWHEHLHLALIYQGIPSDLRSRPEQSHHLPRALLPGDYRQPIEFPTGVPAFNYTEKTFIFTIYDYILRIGQKRCDFLAKCNALHFALSSCVCVCVRVCMPYLWTSGKRFEIETSFFFKLRRITPDIICKSFTQI